MRRLIALIALCAAAALAQPKVVELKYITKSDLGNLLRGFKIVSESDGSGRVLVLSGDPGEVAAAEALIRRIDVPQKNVELVFHIIGAGPGGDAGAKLGPDLEPVIKQLRNTFTYAGYRVLESFSMRLRDGAGHTTSLGILPGGERYDFIVQRMNITPGEKTSVIRMEGLNCVIRSLDERASSLEKKAVYNSAAIQASVDIREGQKVVVGKSNYSGGAYFLVVTARVVE